MPLLPVISGLRVLQKMGWRIVRRESSRVVLTKGGVRVNLSVPDHRTLDRGLLRKLIRAAGLSVEEFIALLD